MSKCSIGPWKWTKSPDGRGTLVDGNSDWIAVGHDYDWGDDTSPYIDVENDVDARLIAEAPALLEALRELLADSPEAAYRAAAVIARVEGTG